jgi:hypothetical protein
LQQLDFQREQARQAIVGRASGDAATASTIVTRKRGGTCVKAASSCSAASAPYGSKQRVWGSMCITPTAPIERSQAVTHPSRPA